MSWKKRLHRTRIRSHTINSLRHRIAATVAPENHEILTDASLTLDRDRHMNSSVSKSAWLKLRNKFFPNKDEATLESEIRHCRVTLRHWSSLQ